MLDPFITLQEAGFSQRDEDTVVEGPGHWSPELIASLDWLRLAELVRAIASHHGCELAGSRVLPDAAVAFGMIENPRSPRPQRALVKITAWNEWGATPQTVIDFAREVRTARNTRGILIAPAGFSPAARLAAQSHRIETVDAVSLHQVMMTLPAQRSDFFLVIATAGDSTTPSCPVCLRKLSRVELPAAAGSEVRVFTDSGLIAEPVVCEGIEIASEADVQFLHEVRARRIRISGHASGDFVCEGAVTLERGGTLEGSVAARSLDVRDGGELRGIFRILEGTPQPFAPPAPRWQWRCRNLDGRPACTGVAFEPHEAAAP